MKIRTSETSIAAVRGSPESSARSKATFRLPTSRAEAFGIDPYGIGLNDILSGKTDSSIQKFRIQDSIEERQIRMGRRYGLRRNETEIAG